MDQIDPINLPSTSQLTCDLSGIENSRLYVDNCVGILREVPDSFDFGTLKVNLASLQISPNFISFGSDCGALFLFSRKHKRALKPLRTTYNEVVTCQKWFYQDDRDYLAVGHRSGTLILIYLPSGQPGGNRKLRQSIHEDAHKGQGVSCVDWSPDGRLLFSCDVAGLILCVKVNFEEELYNTHFVHHGSEPIRCFQATDTRLIVCYSRLFRIFSTSDDYKLIVERELPRTTTGFTIHENNLIFALDNSQLLNYSIDTQKLDTQVDLSENVQRSTKLPELVVAGGMREITRPVWTIDDFKTCTTIFYSNHLLVYSADKIQLLRTADWHSMVQEMSLDLKLQLRNSDHVQISAAVYDPQSTEVFVLASTQKLLRLAFHPPAVELVVFKDEGNSIFSSFSFVAQKSSKQWLNKFTTAGEFQPFAAPINLPTQLRLSESAFRVDEYRTKIASNFNNVFDQFKQTSFGQNEVDKSNLADESDDERAGSRFVDDDSLSIDEEIVEHKPIEVFETKVEVKRKTRMRRGKSSSHADSDKPADPEVENEKSVEVEEEVECAVDERNLNRLFGVLGLTPMPAEPPAAEEVSSEKEEDSARESATSPPKSISLSRTPTPQNLATEIPEDERPQSATGEELHTESEAEEENAAEERKSDVESTNSCTNKAGKAESTSSFLSSTDISIPSSVPSVLTPTNAEYELISRFADQRTDVWNRVKLPYEASSFDVCTQYMVICSKKKSNRPQYRTFEKNDSGVLGGDWTRIKYDASAVAVNDDGSLLWRVESSVVLAPFKVNPKSPFSTAWIEQANEGTVEAIALTNTKAWYLTDKGPFLQMNLPEMGILFHAECPFRLSHIAATERAVWALRAGTGSLVVRVGFKHCPMGVDWVEDTLDAPKEFVSIALYETTGFGLDGNGNLWMCNGVDENQPYGVGAWHQICSPTNVVLPQHRKQFAPIRQWQLKVCSAGVFINVGKFVLSARLPLTAHSLHRCVPERIALNDNFGLLSASGFMGDMHDSVYVCQPNSEIFSYSVRSRNLTSLPPFESTGAIMGLSAVRDRLYVLDSSGVVHVRTDLNTWLLPRGKDWTTVKAEDEEIAIISFAASATSIWAISVDGRILHSDLMPAASDCRWRKVEKPKTLSGGDKLDQIRCSPSGKLVWIVATASSRMWARGDVDEADRRGQTWSEVPNEIRMAEIVVADNAVYGLAASTSQLHRLRSMSVANPAGLYWKPLPLHLRAISVDAFEKRVWGIDLDNRLVKHQMQIYPRGCLSTPELAGGEMETPDPN